MITFTQLTGTTDITSPNKYGNAITTLVNNNSANAVAVAKASVNNKQRYLIQKYFDNERSFAMDIIGQSSGLSLTTTLVTGATSATLSASWNLPTCQQLVNFSSGDQRMTRFIHGSTAISWDAGLSTNANATISTVGVRDYPIPANISKMKSATLTVGQLAFTPKWVQTIQEWNMVNTIPYGSDIPFYLFIYNGTLGIWPIPPTPNNVLTFYYKTRVPDMSFDDYSAGSISGMTVGSYAVIGTSTSWGTTGKYPLNTDISFLNLNLRVDPPYGDGMWYPIQSFQSDTQLTLLLPVVNAPNITGGSTYTIGQLPILQEDFHDMLTIGGKMDYYSSIVKDPEKYKMAQNDYEERLSMLEDYAGTKSVNVDLEDEISQSNPNLYIYYPVN